MHHHRIYDQPRFDKVLQELKLQCDGSQLSPLQVDEFQKMEKEAQPEPHSQPQTCWQPFDLVSSATLKKMEPTFVKEFGTEQWEALKASKLAREVVSITIGRDVGVAFAIGRKLDADDELDGVLEYIVVRADLRGNGYGDKLLNLFAIHFPNFYGEAHSTAVPWFFGKAEFFICNNAATISKHQSSQVNVVPFIRL